MGDPKSAVLQVILLAQAVCSTRRFPCTNTTDGLVTGTIWQGIVQETVGRSVISADRYEVPEELLHHVGLSQKSAHEELLLAQADPRAAVDIPVQVQPAQPVVDQCVQGLGFRVPV